MPLLLITVTAAHIRKRDPSNRQIATIATDIFTQPLNYSSTRNLVAHELMG
jgi:hypothetical protein